MTPLFPKTKGTSSVSSGAVAVDFCASAGGSSDDDSASASAAAPDARWLDRHVLLVEDIVDSGHTLVRLTQAMANCGAASVRVAALLDKRARRAVPYDADYVGWVVEDKFLVGYGLDYAERYRCLPYVAALRPEAYGGGK
jgi:hypoxanthine phosphoribosyltransferase